MMCAGFPEMQSMVCKLFCMDLVTVVSPMFLLVCLSLTSIYSRTHSCLKRLVMAKLFELSVWNKNKSVLSKIIYLYMYQDT